MNEAKTIAAAMKALEDAVMELTKATNVVALMDSTGTFSFGIYCKGFNAISWAETVEEAASKAVAQFQDKKELQAKNLRAELTAMETAAQESTNHDA